MASFRKKLVALYALIIIIQIVSSFVCLYYWNTQALVSSVILACVLFIVIMFGSLLCVQSFLLRRNANNTRARSARISKRRKIAFVVLMLICAIIFYLGFLSVILHYRGQWCAYTFEDHVALCETAYRVSSILTAYNVTHYLSPNSGDTIGLLRTGQILPFEHDVDICYDSTQLERVVSVIRNHTESLQAFQISMPNDFFNNNRLPLYYIPILKEYRSKRYVETVEYLGKTMSAREGEPIVVELNSCSLHFEAEARKLYLQQYNYCFHASGEPMQFWFVRKDDAQKILAQHNIDWRVPKYAHHSWLCSIYQDNYS